jgi:hypothetical protein
MSTKEVVDNIVSKVDDYRRILLDNTIELREFVKHWQSPIITGLIGVIILYIFISKIYNREFKLLRHLIKYRDTLVITHLSDNKEIMKGDFRLCDFYIASSYRSYLPGYQYFDIASKEMLRILLECGCRYIDLDIFPSSFCRDANPVVVSGKEVGLWNFSNSIPLEECLKIIKLYSFSNKVSVNIREPLFIYLNITANENYLLLKKVADLVDKYFGSRLVDNSKYKNYFPQIPIKKLFGRVVILCNSRFKGSPMSEIINMSVEDNYMRSLNSDQVSDNFDKRELTEYNKRNITRVYPVYSGRSSENYNMSNAWLCGCQIVAINYQTSDQFLEFYLDFFGGAPMKLKPEPLRFKPFTYEKPPPQDPKVSFAPMKYSTPFYNITY